MDSLCAVYGFFFLTGADLTSKIGGSIMSSSSHLNGLATNILFFDC